MMHSGFNFVDYIIILSGFALCLKRVADMERYHTLRVVVLTAILALVVVILFQAVGATFFYFPPTPDCEDGHFCLTEMAI